VKKYLKFIAKLNDAVYGRGWFERHVGVNWVRAEEFQRRGAIHFHALIGSSRLAPLYRVAWARKWEELGGGFARIEAIREAESVRRYVTKYVTKGGQIDIGGPLKMPGRVVGTPELGGGVLAD
jgi:hypothetical protein